MSVHSLQVLVLSSCSFNLISELCGDQQYTTSNMIFLYFVSSWSKMNLYGEHDHQHSYRKHQLVWDLSVIVLVYIREKTLANNKKGSSLVQSRKATQVSMDNKGSRLKQIYAKNCQIDVSIGIQ